jgi:hypothetical protein
MVSPSSPIIDYVATETGARMYPSPHDAPRSLNMDSGCWEVKWERKDDCISALVVCCTSIFTLRNSNNFWLSQTLRTVPHLTVSWAHSSMTFNASQQLHNKGQRHNQTDISSPGCAHRGLGYTRSDNIRQIITTPRSGSLSDADNDAPAGHEHLPLSTLHLSFSGGSGNGSTVAGIGVASSAAGEENEWTFIQPGTYSPSPLHGRCLRIVV